jgi:hypothetical protein
MFDFFGVGEEFKRGMAIRATLKGELPAHLNVHQETTMSLEDLIITVFCWVDEH